MSTKSFMVSANFNLQALAEKLCHTYSQRGYSAKWNNFGTGVFVELSKNDDTFNKVIGLCEGLRANLTINNGWLYVNYTDQKWTDKIIAFLIGWLCCWLTWISCGIGLYRQYDLGNNISNTIQMSIDPTGNLVI